jgi:hypothetical protein
MDSEDERAIIAMLLDEYYQEMLHSRPDVPAEEPRSAVPAAGEDEAGETGDPGEAGEGGAGRGGRRRRRGGRGGRSR